MKGRKFFLVLVLIESLILAFWGARAYYRVSQSRYQVSEVEKKLRELNSENEGLKEQEKKAKNPFYLEKLAREKLGLAKKEEIVYKITP
ncbi:MAG: septum formation initiator family protein [Candidatus Aerophobetes bacterium]|nr:septum formation initiator family protein [Candidatus Aerophobetes bacterium]